MVTLYSLKIYVACLTDSSGSLRTHGFYVLLLENVRLHIEASTLRYKHEIQFPFTPFTKRVFIQCEVHERVEIFYCRNFENN